MTLFNSKYAIIIGNGDLEILTNLNQYLINEPFILVLDSAITKIKKYTNLSPNALLGDFDRNFNPSVWLNKFPELKIIHTPDQEKTDFEKGIEFLIEENYTHIIALGLTGKRMDHTFNNISSIAKYNHLIDIKMIDAYSTIFCIEPLFNFIKYYKEDTILSLLPIGKVEGIITKNLAYNLTNESLELGVRTGSSNFVQANNEVQISLKKGKLIIMECKD